ncbi:MAG: hypothetical protein Tsb002_20520 [Wenzhouxiangellaceae bacterium]
MKKLIVWLVEHPIWTFIGAVLGIIGIFGTVLGWFYKPVDPDISALDVLLRDAAGHAIQVARFANYTDNQINNTLGAESGWSASTIKHIEYSQRAIENITNSQGYAKLTAHGRNLFNASESRLEEYKDKQYLRLRVSALKQESCGLVTNAIREIGVLNHEPGIESCFPITPECNKKILNYGKKIDIETDGCLSLDKKYEPVGQIFHHYALQLQSV